MRACMESCWDSPAFAPPQILNVVGVPLLGLLLPLVARQVLREPEAGCDGVLCEAVAVVALPSQHMRIMQL